MTTRITRIEGTKRHQMVLKLEGTLTVADARLLEEICEDVREELGYAITIDMSGVNFIGHQSARILCRLKALPNLSIEGLHLFVQQIIDLTEAANGDSRKDGAGDE
jgi:anti-anti-sigma regulatory factor